MRGHEPLSDTGLLLGSVFVAVAIAGIGILGGQQGPEQVAIASPVTMTAADAVAAGAKPATATPTKPRCLDEKAQGAGVETPCVDGCNYVITAGSFPVKATIRPTNVYSDGSKNPGTEQFLVPGASSMTTLTCKGGAGKDNTLGNAGNGTGPAAFRGLAGLVGTDSPTNSMNVVQPAAAPAAGTAQTPAPGSSAAGGQTGGTQGNGGSGQGGNGTSQQYSSTNLPTQQGCYPTSGGTVCYTPNMPGPNKNGSAGYSEYDFFNSPVDSSGAGGSGAAGAGGGSGGFGGDTAQQLKQAQQLGQYSAQGNGFGGETAGQLFQAQQTGQYYAQGNGFNGEPGAATNCTNPNCNGIFPPPLAPNFPQSPAPPTTAAPSISSAGQVPVEIPAAPGAAPSAIPPSSVANDNVPSAANENTPTAANENVPQAANDNAVKAANDNGSWWKRLPGGGGGGGGGPKVSPICQLMAGKGIYDPIACPSNMLQL